MKLPSRQSFRCRYFSASIKTLVAASLTAGSLLGTAGSTFANTPDFWTGTTGNFNHPTQWSLGRVPVSPAPDGTGSDDAAMFNGGTAIISSDGLVPNDVNAGGTGNGATGDGTYVQTGGSIAIGSGGGWFRLGTFTGTTGTYNLQGGSLTFVSNGDGQINVGEAGGAPVPST